MAQMHAIEISDGQGAGASFSKGRKGPVHLHEYDLLAGKAFYYKGLAGNFRTDLVGAVLHSRRMNAVKSVVILISGRGSNMIEIARRCLAEGWPAKITCVISNRADAPGLQAAADMGIPTAVLDHRNFPDRAAFDASLADLIDQYRPDVVVLAGFMRILTPEFVSRYDDRLINVHPSLLPAFTGLHTHQRALDAGVKVHGATVHFVIAELDAGPIIAQAAVPVLDDDTAEALMARVQAAEHRIYPEAVRWMVSDQLVKENDRTRLAGAAGPALLLPDTDTPR